MITEFFLEEDKVQKYFRSICFVIYLFIIIIRLFYDNKKKKDEEKRPNTGLFSLYLNMYNTFMDKSQIVFHLWLYFTVQGGAAVWCP